ncbi:MAG: vitamin B12 dependent-methionine synthase activation domain-containing protein, partial [Pseudomonadota bacterium]
PSLDEMVHVASEMQRLDFDLPLLIGGATTSPAHTAVKIEPNYEGPVIYVKDASRSVGVAQALVQASTRGALVEKVREENARRRDLHANKKRLAPQVPYPRAQASRFAIEWQGYTPPTPTFTGTRKIDDVSLEDLVDYIDWMPFFNAWEFHGKYPAILTDEIVGEEASKLKRDADAMLEQIIREGWLSPSAVVGFFPANSVDHDDIRIFTDGQRNEELLRLHHLRQQRGKQVGQPQLCLADFIAPRETGLADYIGGFVVSAGHGIDAHTTRFEAAHDDYSSIMLKALADRFAEAFAEYLHERVRKQFWGYAADESFSNDELIREAYAGIRPAPGYPACPDHTEKGLLWDLLDAENATGVSLTESYAMWPTASVSGFYFSHPDAKYFSVGKIARDQVESYAARKGMRIEDAERWLAPNLGYTPGAPEAADAA